MSALREILAKFDIDVDDHKLKHADNLIEKFTETVGGIGAAISGAFALKEIGEFIHSQIEIGSVLNDTSEKLGVASSDLQKFQYAAELSGVSAEGAAHSLGFLNKTMGKALSGNEEGAAVFKSLGVSFKEADGQARPLLDVAVDLADGLEGMHSQAERAAAVVKVFGKQGAALLPMLGHGRKEVEGLFKEFEELGGGMGEDFVKAADEAGDQLERFKFVTQTLKSRIAMGLLPTFTEWTKKLTHGVAELIKLSKETNIIQAGLAALGVAAGFAGLKLAKMFGIIAPGKNGIMGMIQSFLKLGAVILLVAGLALIFEDLYTLMTGGESVIGETLDELGEVGAKEELIKNLRVAWDELKAAFEKAKPVLKELAATLGTEVIQAIPLVAKGIVEIAKAVAALVAGLVGLKEVLSEIPSLKDSVLFTGSFGLLGKPLGSPDPDGKTWTGAGKAVDKAGDRIFGQGGIYGDKPQDPRNFLPGGVAGNDTAVGVGFKRPGGEGNTINQTNKVDVAIQVGDKAQAKDVERAVTTAVQDALAKERLAAQNALNQGKGP